MPRSLGRSASYVASGILLTRILGFVRERVFAHYFGNSIAADAFRAALKIPNVIRNLLGEGTLSASFIPVYAEMVESGDAEGARQLAGVIASLLVLVTALAALAGIVLAPVITDFAAPGFSGATREITVGLVAIMFPMSGIMILSAWCLGILNTHGRFFLPYASPALWNVAQIATLVAAGAYLAGASLARALAYGALAGSALQIGVQLPAATRLVGGIEWGLSLGVPGVRRVVRAWLPMVFGAGVAQISSIIDTQLGSLLGTGAVATLGYAQLLAVLPVSLFGVSVAAAALPELSRSAAQGPPTVLRRQLTPAIRRVAFYIVPSAFVYAAFGGPVVGTLFETGAFGPDDTILVTGVLAAYSVGLPAQGAIRLLASGFYALGDTRTPVRIGAASVILSAVLAFSLMQRFGAPGIALGASIASCVGAGLLFWALQNRTGNLIDRSERRLILWAVVAAGVATAVGGSLAAGGGLASSPPWLRALVTLPTFGLVYLAITWAARHPEARRLAGRLGAGPGGGANG